MKQVSLTWMLLIVLALLGPCWLAADDEVAEPAAPVLALFVRHAETSASTLSGGDPELSEEGQARARALAALLEGAEVTHLYASEYARTAATLAPLAAAKELELVRIGARAQDEQLAALRALPPGSFAVVAGHSNTVPALVSALGGRVDELEQHPQYGAMIDHAVYDRAFLLHLPADARDAVSTLELRVGE